MLSLKALTKIAAVTGFVVAATGYTFRFKIQNDIRENELYKEALQCFYKHQESLELLGHPVKEGRIDISDFEVIGYDDKSGWLTVPLTGSLRKGELRVEMLLDEQSVNSKKYNISKIELKVSDIPNKVFIIKDNSNL